MLKSCLLANISLELARHRVPVVIRDDAAGDNIGTGSMLGPVLSEDLNPEAGTVRLYGLPDILVYQGDGGSAEALDDPGRAPTGADAAPVVFVSVNDTVESVVSGGGVFDAVLLSGLDEHSLLRSYAFMKVIWERDPSAWIGMVLHEPVSAGHAQEMFSRLSAFVRDRLSGEPAFLGRLAHDDLLDRSMEERRPLVLWHEQSEAKDCLVSVSEAFLRAHHGRSSAEGR
jgi:hypothetical protein